MEETATAKVTSATLKNFIEDLRGGDVCESRREKHLPIK
jgi:hypothetical protein